MIFQFNKSILEEDRKEVIKTLIFHHEQNYKSRIKKLKRYYEGKHDAIVSKKSDKFKPNNRVINPFPALIVNTVQGYLLGQPVKYISENKELLEQVLDIYYSNDEEDLNSEILKTMSICGEAFEYVYINEDKEIEFVQLPAEETILIYDNSLKPKPIMCIRYYDVIDIYSNEIQKVEVYTDSTIEYYSLANKNSFVLEEEYTHIFGQVPIIHYKNNEELTGDFEKILSLIDDFDKVISADSDEIEYFRNAYLVLKGMGKIDDKTLAKFRQTGAFVLPTTQSCDAGVDFITKDLNTDSVHAHLDKLIDNIHKFSQVPNFVDTETNTNDSGVAIKQRTWGFEQLIGAKERKLEQGLFQRLRLVLRALNIQKNIVEDSNSFSLRFSRNLPTNVKEDAEILSMIGLTVDTMTEEALTDVLSKVTIIEDPNRVAIGIKGSIQ
ncbi:phage portal protein [Clostridium celatum]|uniref:phage portal protein n=1 Tax=Clostridium celatum TaxID=36834 RepID=UPI001F2FBCFF|nr:phage portal protein [Clostridium celatum]MCE9654202.1 phage portal protein [Clostridium celatum]